MRLSDDEVLRLRVPRELGARFETDQLERFPAVFEVVAIEPNGVVVRRLSYSDRPPNPRRP